MVRPLNVEMRMRFSSNLKSLMRKNNLTHNELAVKLSVPQSTIRNWREGRHIPGPANLRKLAAALKVNSSTLLTGEDL